MRSIKKIKFRNIVFNNFKENQIKFIMKKNGLFVFPAAEPLATLEENSQYHKSLIFSDFVFFDSGYFVFLLRIFKGVKVNKFSGYKFLVNFIKFLKKNNKDKIFLIDPSKSISINNQTFFNSLGLKNTKSYVAPFYKKKSFSDLYLLSLLKKYKPQNIIINIGGGTQEILGSYIKKNINFKAKIICTGGAISYFTGDQAPINNLIDRLYLGWLLRIIFKPTIFLPRYIKALSLVSKIIKNKIEVI